MRMRWRRCFWSRWRRIATRIATLIFEFGARPTSPREFVAALGPFLDALPRVVSLRC